MHSCKYHSLTRLCLTNSFVTRVERRGDRKASDRKSPEAYYQYVEDDFREGNAAIADASSHAVEATCQTQPNLALSCPGPVVPGEGLF